MSGSVIFQSTLSSMNHLFMQHIIKNEEVWLNSIIEGELEHFFNKLKLEKSSSTTLRFFKKIIEEELDYGSYHEDYGYERLLSELKDSVMMLKGHESSWLISLYEDILLKTAAKKREGFREDFKYDSSNLVG